MNDYEILIHKEPFNPYIGVLIKSGDSYGKTIVMEPCDTAHISPTLKVDEICMQKLFNDLWQMGFRPNDGTGNSGHISSIKYHLEDMRKLVFDKK